MSEAAPADPTLLAVDGESAFAELVARLSDQLQTDVPIDLDGLSRDLSALGRQTSWALARFEVDRPSASASGIDASGRL